MRNIKFFTAILISLMPFSQIRVFLYRTILKYKINKSFIGWLSVIAIRDVYIKNSYIGKFNLFKGNFKLVVNENVSIDKFNFFISGSWADSNSKFKQIIIIGKDVLITKQHYFDICGEINIGESSVIGGIKSQFWTHGSLKEDFNIHIGNNCYISSGVKFAPGSLINNKTLVALGSVVINKFTEEKILIGGNPAKILKTNIYWKDLWV
jgi:acetyltransferase-like isoleucine patch superfamily enzyme